MGAGCREHPISAASPEGTQIGLSGDEGECNPLRLPEYTAAYPERPRFPLRSRLTLPDLCIPTEGMRP
jgi:hypothetical protein